MIKERILFLDVAKALCIILVVVGHYVPAYSPDWYMGLHDVIYTFHMPLFMFASGYIYMATRKETDYGSFLMRKVRRLLIPYLTVSVLIISIKLVMQGDAYVENPVSAMSYVRMFYLPEAGYFLWFIWALWWMFVLVPLCKTRNARCLLWVASVVLKCLPVQFPELFCLEQFKNMFVFFMTGVLVCESRAAHAFVSQCKWAQAFVAVCLFAVVEKLHFSENLVWGGKNTLLSFILPFIGILFILELSKWLVRIFRMREKGGALLQVSMASYLIYLLHTTFEGFVKAIVQRLPVVDHGLWYVFIPEVVVVISCGVIVPMWLSCVFKRYRLTRWMFGL